MHLQASSPGVYALGEERDGRFHIGQVGRSDHDLRSALIAHVGGRFTHFKFKYALSAQDAFGTECELYHSFVRLENSIHPTAPEGANLRCSRCCAAVPSGSTRISLQPEGEHRKPEAMNCRNAEKLYDVYCAALEEFHDAKPLFNHAMNRMPFPREQEEVFARLTTARRQYWSHVAEHGCRLTTGATARGREIERALRGEMREAQREFRARSAQYDGLIAVALDAPGTADGILAREQAKGLRDATWKRYDAALRHYAEFIVGERESGEDAPNA